MSKWPKKWIDAAISLSVDFPRVLKMEDVLDALHAVGALKEPPKPREFYICLEHNSVGGHFVQIKDYFPKKAPDGSACFGLGDHQWIKVKEVTDES